MYKYVRKISITILTLLLLLLVLLNTIQFVVNARHSQTILEIAKKDIYAFEVLAKWLNATGVGEKYKVDVYNYKELKNNSITILNEVYNNSSLSMFIGSLQLKILKRLAYGFSDINSSDIANLLLSIEDWVNISIDKTMCKTSFSKFLINVFYEEKQCRYQLSDLDEFTSYIIKLGKNVSEEYLISILSKIYVIKLAAQGKGIYRDTLDRILSSLLHEESIITYLFLEDFVVNTNITVIERSKDMFKNIMFIDHSEKKFTPLTLQDLDRILNKSILLLSVLKEKGVSLSIHDIPKIISYAINIDIHNVLSVLENSTIVINENFIDVYIENTTSTHFLLINTSFINGSGSFHIPLNPFEFYEENTTTTIGVIENIDTGFVAVRESKYLLNHDNIEKKLSKFIEKINAIDIFLPVEIETQNILHPIEFESNVKIYEAKDDIHSNATYFYSIIISLSTVIFIVLVAKGKWLLYHIIKFFSTIRYFTNGNKITKNKHTIQTYFTLFWILIYKISHILNLEVSNSDTHREIYKKINRELNKYDKEFSKELKKFLKEMVKGYEILRYSRNKYNRKTWLRTMHKVNKIIENNGYQNV